MTMYILNASFILAVCLVFYKLFLEKETFFPANRCLLLLFIVLSFGLPLIPISDNYSIRRSLFSGTNQGLDEAIAPKSEINLAQIIRDVTPLQGSREAVPVDQGVGFWQVLIWVYWAGVAIFLINFLVQLVILLMKSFTNPVIVDGKFRIVELSGDQAPCSFGNTIFINPEKYDWETYSQIILHEKVHIEQRHSVDIIVAEVALIFQWFNPFAWIYRRTLENNLEYLTDHELLDNKNVDQQSYQLNLIKVSAPHFPLNLTTNYNQSTLKKRLLMMNAKKSNFHTVWKYVCILPISLLLVSLLNEPKASATELRTDISSNEQIAGEWFANLDGNKCNMKIVTDGLEKSIFQKFLLSDFEDFQRSGTADFTLKRPAGSMRFKGRFEGIEGQGAFTLNVNAAFKTQMEKRGLQNINDHNYLLFFMLQPELKFVDSLSNMGFAKMNLDDLNAVSALGISAKYILSLMNAGLKEITLKEAIALKAMNIDDVYIRDVRNSMNKGLTAERIIAAKALSPKTKVQNSTNNLEVDLSHVPLNLLFEKGLKGKKGKITFDGENFGREMEVFGLNVASDVLKITTNTINLTAEALNKQEFHKLDQAILNKMRPSKAYINSIRALGINLDEEEATALKVMNIEVKHIQSYLQLGMEGLDVEQIITAISMGVDANYIREQRKQGFFSKDLSEYVERKMIPGIKP